MKNLTNYEKDLIQRLKNKDEAMSYLNIALEEYLNDQDSDAFSLALYYITLANGGVTKVAKQTGLNRENLYKIFNGKRKPKLETLHQLLSPYFKLTIMPLEQEELSA